MPDILADIKADSRYRSLAVPDQIEAASIILDRRLASDPSFAALGPADQAYAKRILLAKAVTFEDPQNEAGFKATGEGYVRGSEGDENAKNAYEFVHGMVRGSGILSTLEKLTNGNPQDKQRGLDYYKALDRLQNKSSAWAGTGEFLGNAAEAVAISLVLSPLTSTVTKAAQFGLRGGAAAVKAAKAAGATAKAAQALTRVHPMLEAASSIAADALVTAAPLYLADEAKRAAAGQPSIASEGAGEVLQTLGENAASNFVWGMVAQGVFATAFRFGKAVFNLRTDTMGETMARLMREGDTVEDAFVASGDPLVNAMKSPYVRARNDQILNIREMLKKPDLDLNPLGRGQLLAQDLGEVLERTPEGNYKIWRVKKDGMPGFDEYSTLGDAKNDLAFKTYQKYLTLDDEAKATLTQADAQWFIPRGMALQNQDQLLKSFDATAVDKNLKDLADRGIEPKSPKERPFVTKSEAQSLGSDPQKGIAIQSRIPIDEKLVGNAKAGEFNLFKGKGPVRAVAETSDPNVVFIGTRGATNDEYAKATLKAQEVVQNDPKLTIDEARANLLLDNGIDYFQHPDGSVEFMTVRNAKLIGTIDDIEMVLNPRGKLTGEAAPNIVVETYGKATLDAKTFVGNPAVVTRTAVQAIRSREPEQMRQFIKLYLEGFGKNADVVVSASTRDPWNMKPITVDGNGVVHVTLPGKTKTGGYVAEQQYIKNLFDELKRVTPDVKGLNTGSYWQKLHEKEFTHFPLPKGHDPRNWLSDIAEKTRMPLEWNADGSAVLLAGGKKLTFSTADEVADYFARVTSDEVTLAADFRMQGLALKNINGQKTALDLKTGKIVAQGADLPDMLAKMDYVPKQLPLQYGPSSIRLTDKGIELTIAGQATAMDASKALDEIKKFRDTGLLARQKWLKVSENGTLSVDPSGNYRVYLKGYDAVKNFDNINDARLFLERDAPTWEVLKSVADKKGADLYMTGGRYRMDFMGKTMYAQNTDELKNLVRSIPDIEESVPNILDDLDPSIERDVKEIVQGYMQAQRLKVGRNKFNAAPEVLRDPNAKRMGAWMNFRSATSQFTSWIRDVANRTNRPELLKAMTEFQNGRRLAQAESLMGDRIIQTALSPDGKLLPLASRQKIYYWMSRQNSKEAAEKLGIQFQAKFKESMDDLVLTPQEKIAADKLDGFLKGLSTKFGFEFKDLIFKYMPQLRDFAANGNQELLASLNIANELAEKAFNGNVPASLKFFAENERTNAIFDFVTKDDPLELLMLYNAQGHKKLYMDETWKKISEYIKQDKTGDQRLATRLNTYREAVMGYYHSPGEKVVEDFGMAFFKKLKDTGLLANVPDSQIQNWGKHILRNTMSLTYLVQLGFKPWTAIRNAMQSLTTLAPRFGVVRTMKAYDDVLKGGDAFFDGLRLRGIISDAPPIVDELAGGMTKLGKVQEVALKWLKNGDDLTRAVAYKTAIDSFDDGAAWLASHPQDIDGFKRISGIGVLDPMTQDMLLKQVMDGQLAVAKDSFGAIVVKDTAFTNDAAESSMMRHGLVGKLFGQYGSYSESYRANMFNMLKYGSPADRVRMVTTYLAVCGAMTAAFNQMGVKTNDFLPVAPGVFNGGPAFHMAVGVMGMPSLAVDKLSGNWNVGDASKWKQLGFMASGYVPGGYQLRYLEKAQEYFRQGDSWKGWLSLTGVPTTSEP